MQLSLHNFCDIHQFTDLRLFENTEYPWEVLVNLHVVLKKIARQLPADYRQVRPFVWVGKHTTIASSASLEGPLIIGRGCEIRHGAFFRGNVIIGDGCVVGNSSELKNCILANGVQVPHFNYVGDSILGYKVHLGAGAKCSNVRSDGAPVSVKTPEGTVSTGLYKFGSVIGDYTEIGCNAVINPGVFIGKHSVIYPLTAVRGVIPEKSIVKDGGQIVPKKSEC